MRGEGLRTARKATFLSILTNGTLFILKLVAVLASGSIALLGASFNSLSRMLFDFAILRITSKSHRKAAKGHSFHHARALPMAGIIVAAITAILAFQVLGQALLATPGAIEKSAPTIVIILLIFSVIGEILLSEHYHKHGKRTGNKGMISAAADVRNDMLITLLAMGALVLSSISWLDNFMAIVIALYLFYSAYAMARAKFDYLEGKVPHQGLERKIRELATGVAGVRGVARLKVHHVGAYMHVEIHILVNENINARASSQIAMTTEHDIERLPMVSKAFVITEPVAGNFLNQ